MKVKIVSDGTPDNTSIVTETGEALENVSSILWTLEFGTTAKALVTFVHVPVEATGQLATLDEAADQLSDALEVSVRPSLLYEVLRKHGII